MFGLNRANATPVSTLSFFFIVLLVCLSACTRPNPMLEAAGEGDAGALPDSGTPSAPALTSAADAPLGADLVASEAPTAAARASAGHPRFASVGQKVFLDGSRSVVPPGCQLGWAAHVQNPGVSTLSMARLPMLEVSVSNPGVYRYTVAITCAGGSASDTTAVFAFGAV